MTWRFDGFDCFGGIGAVELFKGRFGCNVEGSAAVAVDVAVVEDLGFSSETSLLGTAEYSGGFGRLAGSPRVEVEEFERLGESTKVNRGKQRSNTLKILTF